MAGPAAARDTVPIVDFINEPLQRGDGGRLNEGERPIELTPPPGGYKLDALVRDGRVTPPEMLTTLGLTADESADPKEVRVIGAVAGGGATITLRATRGDIVLNARREPQK